MNLEVNISRIEEIVGDDIEVKNELLNLFVETCDKTILKLKNIIENTPEDINKNWNEVIHGLTGASDNLGFKDLAIYCRSVDQFSNLSDEEPLQVIKNLEKAKCQVKDLII